MIVKKCDRCGKCYDEYNTTNNAKKKNKWHSISKHR